MKDPANSLATNGGCIHIGLVNNMPDSSLEATERQFRTLLREAADGIPLHLSLFAIPEIVRSDKAKLRIETCYSNICELWDNRLDGLIVTGAEPLAPNLMDEPFWPSLAQLTDWAAENTYSAVWSCLAAHAAVLHMDGIKRCRFDDKLFGVFECVKISDHALMAGIPPYFRTPHSRWNTIPEDGLSACGYRVLTQLKDGGVDAFVRQEKSLFVFFQGHLEYEAGSLLLEYRRDIRRYLNRERELYPSMPQGYFDQHVAASFAELRVQALASRSQQCLANFSPLLQPVAVGSTWRPDGLRFYRSWLHYVFEQKTLALDSAARRPSECNFKSSAAAGSSFLAQ